MGSGDIPRESPRAGHIWAPAEPHEILRDVAGHPVRFLREIQRLRINGMLPQV